MQSANSSNHMLNAKTAERWKLAYQWQRHLRRHALESHSHANDMTTGAQSPAGFFEACKNSCRECTFNNSNACTTPEQLLTCNVLVTMHTCPLRAGLRDVINIRDDLECTKVNGTCAPLPLPVGPLPLAATQNKRTAVSGVEGIQKANVLCVRGDSSVGRQLACRESNQKVLCLVLLNYVNI